MRRFVALSVFCLTSALSVLPADAQYSVRRGANRATGENYHVEIGGYLWNPTPDILIATESAPDVIGDTIDVVNDLDIEKARHNQLRIVLRPGTKHKFRFEYTPIKYEQPDGTLTRDIEFNGIIYSPTLPVSSVIEWKAYRFTYEYDIVYRDRGFFGILFEVKHTDVRAQVANGLFDEFVRARAPIPALGAIGRVYVAPNISITGEFSGFRLPESIDEDYRAKYYDFDIYGTVNFTDNFGAQAGYRSFDVFYRVEEDEGTLKLKGLYLGGVVRF
jgi:hypothetical protein